MRIEIDKINILKAVDENGKEYNIEVFSETVVGGSLNRGDQRDGATLIYKLDNGDNVSQVKKGVFRIVNTGEILNIID